MDSKLQEDLIESKISREMEFLYETYGEHIDNVSGVFKDYQGRSMTVFDQYALGKMLDNYNTYIGMIHESVAQNQLGRVLPVAMDIISAAYVTSIMPAIASIQPIDELVGVIFFKALKAATTRQGVTSGDTLFGATGSRSWDDNKGYASDFIEDETGDEGIFTDSAGDLHSEGTLDQTPIRKGSLKMWILDATDSATKLLEATDDRDGNIFGVGIQGSINYTTGAWEIDLVSDTSDLANDDSIHFSYNMDMEYDVDNIPKLTWGTTDETVRARIFMLEGQWGIVTEYALAKRFGKALDTEIANDLRAEINAEIAAAAIALMYDGTTGNEDWSTDPPTGTSAYEHRMMFRDAITNAGSNIRANAGKGTVTYIICGASMFTVLSSQPGYKALASGSEIGPHLAGMLDNVSIIKASSSALVPDAEAIAGYRGSNWFEAGVVYAPYLPLAVTGTVNVGSSMNMARGAFTAAGLKVVLPNFLTKITLT